MNDGSLLSDVLAAADFHSRHTTRIAASTATVMRAVRELDMGRSLVVRLLFGLRGLPRSALRWDGLERLGFMRLAEGEHELVLGLVGQPWRAGGGLRQMAPQDFGAFAEPGYARVAWNFRAEHHGADDVDLSTETRIACTDDVSRRKFRRYWRCVSPFSGLTRRTMLRLIRQDVT